MAIQKGMSSRQMSSLFRKLRYKVGKNKAFKIVGNLKVQSKWQSMGTKNRAKMRIRYKDSDKDGVPNKWDCSPYNKWKQDEFTADDYIEHAPDELDSDWERLSTSEKKKWKKNKEKEDSDFRINMIKNSGY